MKPKIYLLFILFISICQTSFGQLKVSQYGGVGMGIEPRSDIKLLIKGNLVLTTYPEIPAPLTRFTEFRFKVGNGWPGCEFGTPTRKIAVWSSEVGYNNLYGAHFYEVSDSRLKANTTLIQNGLHMVMQMQPYSYNRRDTLGGAPSATKEYGFLAQDVAQFLPELTDSAKDGLLVLDYQQIIPFLVAAIKEQQTVIDSLRNTPSNRSMTVPANDSTQNNTVQIDVTLSSRKIVLDQNAPNPFRDQTTITYYIPKDANIVVLFLLIWMEK